MSSRAERPELEPAPSRARLAAQLDIDGNAHEIAPAHERMRLFEPAPAQLPGQTSMGELA